MLLRNAMLAAEHLARGFPILLITGPRQSRNEIDLLLESGDGLRAIEIKSGATFVPEWLKWIKRWQQLAGDCALTPWLVYSGADGYRREGVEAVPGRWAYCRQ